MATPADQVTRPRRHWFRRRDTQPAALIRGPADWQRIGELAAQMQRRELLDSITANRRRRERAQEELAAAYGELDELLAFGRASGVASYTDMGEAAGMTRKGAHKRLTRAGETPDAIAA
jgi:hypothetical protein